MGGADIKPISPAEEIICPFCPLTPIINNFLNQDGQLTTEYRCPNLHYGYIPFSDLFKNKSKHGKFCSLCKKEPVKIDQVKKNTIKNEEELLYCGVCKEYICVKCRPEHDKEKESHKILIEKSKVNFTCLEHNKNFCSFCFSCLADACPDCIRHEKHIVKSFDVLLKEFSMEGYQYILEKYDGYIKSFKRQVKYNPQLFELFKKRNKILLSYLMYLYEHVQYKKKLNQLNSEIIINLLNVIDQDYEAPQDMRENKEKFEKYCKNHLILRYKPISFICTFSKNKQDFKISRTELIEYYKLESKVDHQIIFKYSQIGDLIIFALDCVLYLLPPKISSENEISKISLPEKIFSFNILSKNILVICFKNSEMVFYKLIDKYPYYVEDNTLPKVESPSEDIIVQIIGNFNKYLVSRTLGGKIHLHSEAKKKGYFEISASDYIIYSSSAGNDLYELKAVWKKYVICKDNDNIVVRDLSKPKLNVLKKEKLLTEKEKDFIVFNGNILIPKKKEILFYNIPHLDNVSKLVLNDNILSINIVNPRTMIVVEVTYIEQLEVNTWKRLYNQINLQPNKTLNNFRPIGAGKKLFFYSKSDNIIYNAFHDKI